MRKVVLLFIITILSVSCAPKHKYTTMNKVMYAALIAGQTADVISTSNGLDKPGVYEMNKVYGSNPSDARLVMTKAVGITAITIIGHFSTPNVRNVIYGFGALIGGGAAYHNGNQ